MKKIKSALIVLAFCILLPTLAGATDYSNMEIITENFLLDPVNNLEITNAAVSISPDKVEIEFVSHPSSLEAYGATLRAILSAYVVIVNYYPDVGDLEILHMDDNAPTRPVILVKRVGSS